MHQSRRDGIVKPRTGVLVTVTREHLEPRRGGTEVLRRLKPAHLPLLRSAASEAVP